MKRDRWNVAFTQYMVPRRICIIAYRWSSVAYYMVRRRYPSAVPWSASHTVHVACYVVAHRICIAYSMVQRCILYGPTFPCSMVSIAYRPRRVLCGRASHITVIVAHCVVRSAYYMDRHNILYGPRSHTICGFASRSRSSK